MIAADTSTWIAVLEGDGGEDVQLLDKALGDRQVLMVPAVLTELLSDPQLPANAAESLRELPMLGIEAGYWNRAGELRAKVLSKGLDHGVPLLTRDRDFRAFAETAGLDLAIE